jgi:type IV pilus assembly protein PilQ
MTRKINLTLSICFVFCLLGNAQDQTSEARLMHLKSRLDTLAKTTAGLKQQVDFNVDRARLSDFVRAMANLHALNISLDKHLDAIQLSNNFSNATVSDVLIYLCKAHDLTLDFTGNILSLKKHAPPPKKMIPREIPMAYNPLSKRITLELKRDSLSVVFKKIADLTDKNLVFSSELSNRKLQGYFKDMPLQTALEKLAYVNNLTVNKTQEGVYLFETSEPLETTRQSRQTKRSPVRFRNSNFYYTLLDSVTKQLNVDFENTSIEAIVKTIGHELNIDVFTATPLNTAGKVTFKANKIGFDRMLEKILENSDFTYKKENDLYVFGKKEVLSLRNSIVIPLQHRSIETMRENASGGRSRSRNQLGSTNYNQSVNPTYAMNRRENRSQNTSVSSNSQRSYNSNNAINNATNNEALLRIFPKDVTEDLEITTDLELNSFVVSGPSQNIERFRKFIERIDKPVPVILIEVMFIEYSQSTLLETGMDLGIDEGSTNTQGTLFPKAEMSLGASTINKIIGGFDGFESRNLGNVVPNFYANIKALESNGDLQIKSTPKLSTLNGHRAHLSIGETTYYVVTNTDYIGSQIPQTTTITNYQPIAAEMALSIQPLVSGDGNITMNLNVVQSNFNNSRIDENAPPDMNSREFNSTIRVKDQDLIILGGLEEKTSIESGSGVPFLSRIPLLKWLFSNKSKEDSKKKLSILIKPTILP